MWDYHLLPKVAPDVLKAQDTKPAGRDEEGKDVGGGGEKRSGSEAEPRAGIAAWKVISQLEAGEFCLAPSTSEMVPEKKLLLAFVTANFR